MPGPDPSKTPPSAAEVLREQPENARFETNLADLAARFAAQSGGGLSPELSTDLALEIVLNEIVEQACLATGATGAAIVLEREGEMVCRASSGSTAPPLGSRLDTSTGLSGECFKTRRTQWCDDTRSDQRVDMKASERLGVRSVVVMPLLRGDEVIGVIELFSYQPYAFGVRDERTLEVLADRTLNNLDHAARPLALQSAPPATVQPKQNRSEVHRPEEDGHEEDRSEEDKRKNNRAKEVTSPPGRSFEKSSRETFRRETSGRETFRIVEREDERKDSQEERQAIRRDAHHWLGSGDWLIGAAALACAILLGLVLGRHLGARNAAQHAHPAVVNPQAAEVPSAPKSSEPGDVQPSAPAKPNGVQVPPGGLLVLENGKEVFRMPPSDKQKAGADQPVGIERASSIEPERVVELSPAAAQGILLQRVEPEYPEAARQQNIEGAVVLEVHIGTDGGVQDVQVVTGPPVLAQAATEAVRQWKFKPRLVKGSPVEMQTKITLNFRLPQVKLPQQRVPQ
jgi:TonB family protein